MATSEQENTKWWEEMMTWLKEGLNPTMKIASLTVEGAGRMIKKFRTARQNVSSALSEDQAWEVWKRYGALACERGADVTEKVEITHQGTCMERALLWIKTALVGESGTVMGDPHLSGICDSRWRSIPWQSAKDYRKRVEDIMLVWSLSLDAPITAESQPMVPLPDPQQLMSQAADVIKEVVSRTDGGELHANLMNNGGTRGWNTFKDFMESVSRVESTVEWKASISPIMPFKHDIDDYCEEERSQGHCERQQCQSRHCNWYPQQQAVSVAAIRVQALRPSWRTTRGGGSRDNICYSELDEEEQERGSASRKRRRHGGNRPNKTKREKAKQAKGPWNSTDRVPPGTGAIFTDRVPPGTGSKS